MRKRHTITIFDVYSLDTLNQIIFTLLIIKATEKNVTIKVISLRGYEEFAADINR